MSIPQTLGLAWQHYQAGRLSQAEMLCCQIVQADSAHSGALHLLGMIASRAQRGDQAVDFFEGVLRLVPDFVDAWIDLAIELTIQGKQAEALGVFRKALRVKPDHAQAHFSLGVALQLQGKHYSEAYSNLGNVLLELGQPERAEQCLQQALRLKPDCAEAAYNLGLVLWTQGRPEEAAISYRRAIELEPQHFRAYLNLGNCLKDQGQLDEAIASYLAAIELEPANASFHSTLILASHYHPRLDQKALQEETRRWSQRYAAPLQKVIQPHSNAREPDRRLRIGYVSPDFHEHPASSSTVPLLSNHDHEKFEIFCYAQAERPDAFTERLRSCADHWHSTVGLTDEQAADMIRRHQIDILVDLALHTANNRLLVFARKPAPVHVTWLGYPGTTGLSTIDYRLTDPCLDPPGQFDDFYSEDSVRLPETFWCYYPVTETPPVNALPSKTTGAITFGCLNNDSPATWSRSIDTSGSVGASTLTDRPTEGDTNGAVNSRVFLSAIGAPWMLLLDELRARR
jgi:protein O-GlcNAc transferase